MFMKYSDRDAFGRLKKYRSAKDAGLLWSLLDLNPILVLDGNTLDGSNDAAIAQWNDISGNDNHVLQANETQKPLLKTGANGINGHNCIYCDGYNDYLSVAISGMSAYREMTWFIVQETAQTGVNKLSMQPPGTAGAWGFSNEKISINNITVNITNDTSPHILTVSFKESDSYQAWQDGVSKGSGALGGLSYWSPTGVNVGTNYGADGYWWQGKIAYLAMFPTQLSTEDRAKVYSFLTARYIP